MSEEDKKLNKDSTEIENSDISGGKLFNRWFGSSKKSAKKSKKSSEKQSSEDVDLGDFDEEKGFGGVSGGCHGHFSPPNGSGGSFPGGGRHHHPHGHRPRFGHGPGPMPPPPYGFGPPPGPPPGRFEHSIPGEKSDSTTDSNPESGTPPPSSP